jgi:hypothetical protein
MAGLSAVRSRRAHPRSSRAPAPSASVATASPLLHLHRSIGNLAFQRLVHTPAVQRQPKPAPDPDAVKDKEEADKAKVEACLKQQTELLPKVGTVAHIAREVQLDQMLGRTLRQPFEADVRADRDARKFVCEGGVGAMMALFFNRDYKNRLDVDRARAEFAKNPTVYSPAGWDTIKQTKDHLIKRFGITIEPGDKDWSPDDVGFLAQALGKLNDDEKPLIRGYHFIRWTTRCNQEIAKNPDYQCTDLVKDYGTCGLHEAEIASRRYTITMYDCFTSDPEEFGKLKADVPAGAATIVHEIGHAMEYGKLRLALEQWADATKKYKRLKEKADAATTDKKSAVEQANQAKTEMDDADKVVKALTSTSVLDKFAALIKGKPALTPYSKTGLNEAFADAFMMFKVAPTKLEAANKKLFEWFTAGGFR